MDQILQFSDAKIINTSLKTRLYWICSKALRGDTLLQNIALRGDALLQNIALRGDALLQNIAFRAYIL